MLAGQVRVLQTSSVLEPRVVLRSHEGFLTPTLGEAKCVCVPRDATGAEGRRSHRDACKIEAQVWGENRWRPRGETAGVGEGKKMPQSSLKQGGGMGRVKQRGVRFWMLGHQGHRLSKYTGDL